jgi:hypothetical protein
MSYFYLGSPSTNTACVTLRDIQAINGSVVKNIDGTISVYTPNGPVFLSKMCCENFSYENYTFDIGSQTCRWKPLNQNCVNDTLKVTINPYGNDGSIFYVDDTDDVCDLKISFDYLFKISCETLSNYLNGIPRRTDECQKPIEVFETLDVDITLDVILNNSLTTVATYPLFQQIGHGNLYNYLLNNINTGFLVCGDPTPIEILNGITGCTTMDINASFGSHVNVFSCLKVRDSIFNDLMVQSGLPSRTILNNSLSGNSFGSRWLHYETIVTDPLIINAIKNQKIKLSVEINNTCSDLCVLMDNIRLDKTCTHISENKMFITKPPSFELDRIIDNKKSWINNTTFTNRTFNIRNNASTNPIRQTDYDVNDERLVINTKEIDLDISIASAIETDVWCYISDNPCLLTALTQTFDCLCESLHCCSGDTTIDFNVLMTQQLSAVTTIEEFEYYLNSELIDAKSRKVLSGYPTLRALYDRYTNSSLYCTTTSSAFNYADIDKFSHLIDSYWVDIVEQVVPATTIWGSVKIYGNTIFDQQKFAYKKSNLYTCILSVSGVDQIGANLNIGVDLTVLGNNNNNITQQCTGVYIKKIDNGSEFLGTIK